MKTVYVALEQVDERVDRWEQVARGACTGERDATYSKSGLMRAVLRYALARLTESVSAVGATKVGNSIYADRLRTQIVHKKVMQFHVTDDQVNTLTTWAVSFPEWDWKTLCSLLVFTGLRQLDEEDPVEVREFFREHFVEEAAAGLRVGRPRKAASAG
jgi:hypothetical protein